MLNAMLKHNRINLKEFQEADKLEKAYYIESWNEHGKQLTR